MVLCPPWLRTRPHRKGSLRDRRWGRKCPAPSEKQRISGGAEPGGWKGGPGPCRPAGCSLPGHGAPLKRPIESCLCFRKAVGRSGEDTLEGGTARRVIVGVLSGGRGG